MSGYEFGSKDHLRALSDMERVWPLPRPRALTESNFVRYCRARARVARAQARVCLLSIRALRFDDTPPEGEERRLYAAARRWRDSARDWQAMARGEP